MCVASSMRRILITEDVLHFGVRGTLKVSVSDIWDNVKHTNMQITGVPEEEDKKKVHEKMLEEIIVENFPKMGKEIATQIQEIQRSPKE